MPPPAKISVGRLNLSNGRKKIRYNIHHVKPFIPNYMINIIISLIS